MAKTDKKADKKSKAALDKKSSSTKLPVKPNPTSVVPRKGKTPAKAVRKDDTENDSDDSEPENSLHPVSNGKNNSDDSSQDSSSEDEAPKAAQVKYLPTKGTPLNKITSTKAASGNIKKTHHSSSSSEDSEDSDDSVEPTPKKVASKVIAKSTKLAPPKMTAAALSDSDSSSDSDDDEPVQQKALSSNVVPLAKDPSSASSDDDSDSSEEASMSVNKRTAPLEGSSDESSDDSSGEDEDIEMASAPVVNAGKRKATDQDPAPPKKIKLTTDTAAADAQSKSVFVGRLSWSIDNDRLAQEFSVCGEVVSATVQMDRNTGKSRGFGYVHFTTSEAVEKALQMNGQEIDGRAVNIDRSQSQDKTQAREKRANAFGDETSPPSTTLFVGNLSFGVTEDTVWSFFNEWGVKSVRLPTDRETGRPKGFGYVEFEDIEGAKKAFEGASGAEIEGRNIRVDFSQPRDSSGAFGGSRGGRGGGRGGFGGARGGRGGFGDRGGRGGRGRGGERGGRGRGTSRGGPRTGGITAFEGKKTTF